MLFYQFHARIHVTTFSSKKCSVRLLSKKLTSTIWWCKMTSKVKIDVLTSCTRPSYATSYNTEMSRTDENHGTPGYARRIVNIKTKKETPLPHYTLFTRKSISPSLWCGLLRKSEMKKIGKKQVPLQVYVTPFWVSEGEIWLQSRFTYRSANTGIWCWLPHRGTQIVHLWLAAETHKSHCRFK